MEDSLNLGVSVPWQCETRFEGMRTGVNRFLWVRFRTPSFCTAVAPSQSPPIWEFSAVGCADLGRSGLPAVRCRARRPSCTTAPQGARRAKPMSTTLTIVSTKAHSRAAFRSAPVLRGMDGATRQPLGLPGSSNSPEALSWSPGCWSPCSSIRCLGGTL